MKIRLGNVAILLGIGIFALLLVSKVGWWGLHQWRIWRADGVYCFPLFEEDGNYFLYGDDCPNPDVPSVSETQSI